MAATVNITIDQGSHFEYLFELSGTSQMDMTNAVAYSSMSREYGSNTTIDFDTDLVGSNVTITLTGSESANLEPGTWVYDVVIRNESNVIVRVVQGRASVTPRVTIVP